MTTFFTIVSFLLGFAVVFVFVYAQDLEKREWFESYLLYKYFAYLILITGIICGVACGFLYKMPILDYEYQAIKEGDLITYYVFNTPLMFYIWLSAIVLSLSFGAVSAHLKNQNSIIELLKKDNQETGESEQSEKSEQSEQSVKQDAPEQEQNPV
ncbi:MAG: hypothetical protein K5664_00080, partial [Firmicutes bacterium]|nr:hypothetical protein [Bacillota bacterium]